MKFYLHPYSLHYFQARLGVLLGLQYNPSDTWERTCSLLQLRFIMVISGEPLSGGHLFIPWGWLLNHYHPNILPQAHKFIRKKDMSIFSVLRRWITAKVTKILFEVWIQTFGKDRSQPEIFTGGHVLIEHARVLFRFCICWLQWKTSEANSKKMFDWGIGNHEISENLSASSTYVVWRSSYLAQQKTI